MNWRNETYAIKANIFELPLSFHSPFLAVFLPLKVPAVWLRLALTAFPILLPVHDYLLETRRVHPLLLATFFPKEMIKLDLHHFPFKIV